MFAHFEAESHWVYVWFFQRLLQRLEWSSCVAKSRLRLMLTTRKSCERRSNILDMMIHQRVSKCLDYSSIWLQNATVSYRSFCSSCHLRKWICWSLILLLHKNIGQRLLKLEICMLFLIFAAFSFNTFISLKLWCNAGFGICLCTLLADYSCIAALIENSGYSGPQG